MRAILQRVSQASVTVEGQVVGAIQSGLLVLLGVGHGDSDAEARLLAEKTAHLRIFADAEGRFNRSLIDLNGAALVVSQFTLYADTRKGRRPSFIEAALPELAAPLVQVYADSLRSFGVDVAHGRFGAHMQVALINDGPVTISLDSATLRQPRV
ncbi:D-aminoacyl-tRNA deacylase [Candidatus Oscillochloris fontis]|uniref:D-aminoacyl-tRNA deacylase n=1 Tax=Candidatus Oscillochloris fontis TaxID=2496868 RepID=UPI00101C3C89|nr:D-aminoacyl-tRNA deacylase [Candidatus Oscillochloris fontis]